MKQSKNLKSNDKECKYCGNSIKYTASVCHYCGKYQQKWKNFITNLPILISLGLLILSMLQYRISRNEKKEASDALERAKNIEHDLKDMGINFSKAIETSSSLIKEVYKGTFIWNDEENKSISNRIDSLNKEMMKMSESFLNKYE